MKKRFILLILILVVGGGLGLYAYLRGYFSITSRTRKVLAFLRNPGSQQDLVIPGLTRCGDTPFLMPTTGMIGFLWDDSFRPGHRHQGIDIFGGTDVGLTPVYAVYDGYLTRQPEWKSSLIIRVPSDPIQPGRQIWTYYTHMADENGRSLIVNTFPQGTLDVFVPAGTLLGYQGNFSGTPNRPTGVHLHFSIVMDDGQGRFMNELEIGNTLDPSPYFGMALNGVLNPDKIPVCLHPEKHE